MKGYVTIPFYRDAECTDFYKNLKIAVIDRELAEDNSHQSRIFEGRNNTSITVYYSGKYSNASFPTALLVSTEGIVYNGNTPSDTVKPRVKDTVIASSVLNVNKPVVSELLDGNFIDTLVAPGGDFNLFNFDEGVSGREYYMKNGATYSVMITTEYDSNIGANIQRKTCRFKKGSTTREISRIINSTIVNTYLAERYTTCMDKVRYDAYMLDHPDSYCRYGYSCVLYMYDDNTGINPQDLYSLDLRHEWQGENRGNVTYFIGQSRITTSSAGPGQMQRFFSAILGITGEVTIDKVKDIGGGDFKELNEDDENTYPGGGNDKNPYPEDGESGKGTFDDRNDEVDFPTLPTWDATSTGFIEIWNPNMSEILDLYTFMWSDQLSIWEKIKHWFNDPMDAIISLGFVPVDPTVSGKRNVSLALVDTGIQMNHVSRQFVEFDFGTQILDEYYGACWDFSPYTKVQIYLPYIGIQELDTDDVMGASLHLKYYVDLLTGATSAQLKCTRSRDKLNGIVYTWEGNCLMRIPITGADARGFMSSLMQAVAIGGLSLINPAAGALSTTLNEGGGDDENRSAIGQWTNPVMATYSAANVLGQKIHVQRGSRVDANVGVISPQCAYLIINRPISGMPKGWNEYAGYPSMKIKALSSQKGFTKVAYIKLNNLEATSEEIAELDSILKDGVIL